MADLWWGFWGDYPKVRFNGREYAQIGDRLYSRHAVDHFLPSGRRTVGNVPVAAGEGGGYAFDPKARSISPNWVEHTIRNGKKEFFTEKGEARINHTCGELQVTTAHGTRVVVTVMYKHEDK
jgi:hypothetical protein